MAFCFCAYWELGENVGTEFSFNLISFNHALLRPNVIYLPCLDPWKVVGDSRLRLCAGCLSGQTATTLLTVVVVGFHSPGRHDNRRPVWFRRWRHILWMLGGRKGSRLWCLYRTERTGGICRGLALRLRNKVYIVVVQFTFIASK